MQKKFIVIFSLFIVSVLFIAGCQESVGGNYRTDYTGQRSSCPGGPTQGTPVYIQTISSKECYVVVGCEEKSVIISDVITKSSSDSYKPVVKAWIGSAQFCQGARGIYTESEVKIVTGCQYDGSCKTGLTPVLGTQ